MKIKQIIFMLLLLNAYLLVQRVGDLSHPINTIIFLTAIFLYFGLFDFLFSKKNLIISALLSISIIAFLYKAVPSIPFFYENFDSGTIAFLAVMPFLLTFTKNEAARITFLIFFMIPFMVFTKNDGIAETAAIATYLCIGLLAVRNDKI